MHGIPGGRVTRRRARSTVLTVLTALTLVVTTAATTQAAEPPATKRASSAAKSAAPSTGSTQTSRFVAGSGEECTPTAPGSKERRAGAVESCVTVTPAPVTAKPRTAAAAAAANCSITNPGNYSYERFSYCVTGINVTYIMRDSRGLEIGRGTLAVSTSADLSPTATTWNEHVTVAMTSASGDVAALSAKFRASCDAGCTATKDAPWWASTVTIGKPLTGDVTFSSPQSTGSSASFFTSYKMYVTAPGATPTDPNASWKNAREIRCDDAVGGGSGAGCAVPSITPVVPMKAAGSDPGGAVAAYQWTQQNLNDGWGEGKLLTRATAGVSNRAAATCAGFVAITTLVETDTCAGFPFGEAKEGGTRGDQCVEVIPNLGNGEWDTYVLGNAKELDKSKPCVRAHVNAADKQFADTQLANGFAGQRVIDNDQFKLKFSTPNTGPHARCLNTNPLGAVPNGDGWNMYTTEPVPHVNKTVTPIGPAGTRPTRAQACLARNTSKGSPAKGDITGWLDAQKFNTDNPPTSSQARCHLIANILGGTGQIEDLGQDNLVPCWQQGMNTGTPSMRTFESMAQDKIKGPVSAFGADDAIFYEVTPVYRDATSTIPVGVTMHANIERANGTIEELFPNVYVPNTKKDTLLLNLGN
ncbi:DNA/RNA non-specific endonuclease [Streptomyces sp. NPDC006334]|uniref:DNA/RNA non-specific endonuclease n=1 Tax=Streptomyces sp. NPDC006334 TaxID=3156754 RepID=UPI0033AC7332